MTKKFNFIENRIESFKNAFVGLKDILLTEHNAWIHAGFTIVILLMSCWLRIDFVKFILIIIVICLVWIVEAFNTVLEIVIDIVSPEYTKAAQRAKDIAAAAVLFASLGAFMTGIVLLGPPLLIRLGF